MNPSSSRFDSVVDEQASLWAARLEGGRLSTAHQAELDAWLEAAPIHREALSAYCQFSSDLEPIVPALVGAGAVAMPDLEETPRSTKVLSFRRWAPALLAAAAAIAVVVHFSTRAPLDQFESISAPIAMQRSVTLADGTQIDLNAHTSVVVDTDREERRVRLGGGQAFFEVSPDPDRPFIVETPMGTVRVTGTAFDVRSDAGTEGLQITVWEGSVQVRVGAAQADRSVSPVSLTGHDQLTIDAHGMRQAQLSSSELEAELAWRQGEIVFAGETLKEALLRFGHYHGRAIRVADLASELHIGGRYALDDLDGFLSALEAVLPVRVSKDWGGMIQVDLRP